MGWEGQLHFGDYCVPSPSSEEGQQQAAAAKTTTGRQKQPMLSAGVVLVGGVGLFRDALFLSAGPQP